MKIFAVKTFANCPETVKFTKVFVCERFLLYGITSQQKAAHSIIAGFGSKALPYDLSHGHFKFTAAMRTMRGKGPQYNENFRLSSKKR